MPTPATASISRSLKMATMAGPELTMDCGARECSKPSTTRLGKYAGVMSLVRVAREQVCSPLTPVLPSPAMLMAMLSHSIQAMAKRCGMLEQVHRCRAHQLRTNWMAVSTFFLEAAAYCLHGHCPT